MKTKSFVLPLVLLTLAVFTAKAQSVINITPDEQVLLRNPMQGWVIYAGLGDGLADNFWSLYDDFDCVEDGVAKKVKVSDYATTLYIRAAWSLFNPSEDVYVWDEGQENTAAGRRFRMLMNGAMERGLKVAFTFVVDSRDKSFDFTPAFVRSAGAEGYTSQTGSRTVWSPYPDDPVFQAKYEKFLRAFAAKYDDPDVTMFVSGFGLGKWGETHSLLYKNADKDAAREAVFEWITDLMSDVFQKVPIVINYHRNILMTTNDSNPTLRAASKAYIDRAVAKGFSLRHDAFGMGSYYRQWELDYALSQKHNRPILMEGGWVESSHGSSAYSDAAWTDQSHTYTNYADVRRGEYSDGRASFVNMMDLRYNNNTNQSETHSWFTAAFDLVKSFIREGGYRLYPDQITVPVEAKRGMSVNLSHRWNNLGWGYCPNNIPQWNYKYRVAFALLDEDNTVKHVFVDNTTDPSTWINGTPVSYNTTVSLADVPLGTYKWAVGIVDTSKNNEIGLSLSVDQNLLTSEGWLPLDDINVTGDGYFVRTSASGDGDGSSWDNAMSFSTFESRYGSFNDGDQFFFAEGTYNFSNTLTTTKAHSFTGGFPNGLTGKTKTISYPTSTPTIFSGQELRSRLLAFDMSGRAADEKEQPVSIKGIEFTKTKNNATGDVAVGALYLRDCQNVTVSRCRFYDNSSAGYGGSGVRSEFSKIRFLDCSFTDNSAESRGAAVRLSSNNGTKGYTVFERCLIARNTITNNVGSAICMQHGNALYIINSTIADNSASSGGAIYVNGKNASFNNNLYIVSSTVAGNTATTNTAQLQMSGGASLHLANSIIVGAEYGSDGTGSAAIAIAPANMSGNASFTTFESAGYNMTGSIRSTNTPTWAGSDYHGEKYTYSHLFGDNILGTNGVIAPKYVPQSTTNANLEAMVAEWGIDQTVNLRNDQLNSGARGGRTPGAYAATAMTTSVTVGNTGYATYYNDYGYIMPSGIQGAVVPHASEGSVTVDYIYNGGDEIPARSALIWKSAPKTYSGITLKMGESSTVTNMLRGSQEAEMTVADCDNPRFYKLSTGSYGIGFYYENEAGGAFMNGANRAYLVIPGTISMAKYFLIDDDLTAITQLPSNLEPRVSTIYDLQGRKVVDMKKGIYIVNGKKVIVR